jgi:hypothetical protein
VNHRRHMISCSPCCLKLRNKENKSTINFKMSPSGMHVYSPPDFGLSLFQTNNVNSKFPTPRQIEVAKRARDLYEMIRQPSYADFIAIIQKILLPNDNYSVWDVENAQRIYGHDIGSLQGKTVQCWCIGKSIDVVEFFCLHQNLSHAAIRGKDHTVKCQSYMLIIEFNILLPTLKPFLNSLFKLIELKQRFGTYLTSFNVILNFSPLSWVTSYFNFQF